MKKRSMLAIASLAAGVVTALVTPPPHATAADHGTTGGGTTGLLQNDTALGTLAEEAGQIVTESALQTPNIEGLA
ncbi:hypothetical protein GPZ77_31390 [Streptomyces sp. QHH-9511]|uniref:hypothetical protein n=1 Tax=Streptomyces sp. QHH-9511 TaxID=2684468 RepID=UPI00131797A7|nr:hypothetical protein [Streptomyces sp. QHH-9511]QGZ52248.1 hypothetical protein GPZ77_31390 [Streptomyces sp. QHH-9511]